LKTVSESWGHSACHLISVFQSSTFKFP
jgi:hypothetical protein